MSGKQIWCLDIAEVQRIKAGVLKYISHNQTARSKQKSSLSPSTPQSPLIKAKNLKPDKKENIKTKKRRQTLNNPNMGKNPNKQDASRTHVTQKMPKGFFLDNAGKIMRESNKDFNQHSLENVPYFELQPTGKAIQSKQNKYFKVSKNEQAKINDESKNKKTPKEEKKINLCEQQIEILAYQDIEANLNLFERTKEQSGIKPIVKPIEEKQKPKQVKIKIEQKPIVVEETKIKSVFELAKMFGGGNSGKPIAPQSVEKPTIAQNSIIATVSESDSKSLLSFGFSENKDKKNGNILNILPVQKNLQLSKQRKRSQTCKQEFYQQETDFNVFQSMHPNQFYQKNRKMETQRFDLDKTIPQFKSIVFTANETEVLKKKYNLLNARLNQLKQKVLEEQQLCGDRSRNLIESLDYIEERNSVHLYNKLSPLKSLQSAMARKKWKACRQQGDKANPAPKKLQEVLRR